jgi:hypothetical protein
LGIFVGAWCNVKELYGMKRDDVQPERNLLAPTLSPAPSLQLSRQPAPPTEMTPVPKGRKKTPPFGGA